MKRCAVQAQAPQSDTWEMVYYTDDLSKERRYAAGLLQSERVGATRVVDTGTGEVVGDELSH